METAHLLCDSDDFEGVILTLKKEGAELERELDEAKAEVAQLKEENYLVWQRFDKQMAAEAEVERLNNTLENTRISRATMIEDRNLLDQELAASNAEVERLRDALDTLTLVVGLTPILGNKEALQEAFNLARKALNPTEK
jgi:chromosome segregation ATPase